MTFQRTLLQFDVAMPVLDPEAVISMLQRVSPELARAALAVDLTDPISTRPSPGSSVVLASIQEMGRTGVDTAYVEGYRRYGDRVSADFSFKYVGHRDYWSVFYDRAGTPFVHYSVELAPTDVAFEKTGRGYATSFETSLEVRDASGRLIVSEDDIRQAFAERRAG